MQKTGSRPEGRLPVKQQSIGLALAELGSATCGHVIASFVSFAFALRRKLAHFAAPPFPTEPAALGFGGDPFVYFLRD